MTGSRGSLRTTGSRKLPQDDIQAVKIPRSTANTLTRSGSLCLCDDWCVAMGQVLVILLVLIIILIGAYFAHLAHVRRRQELAALAAELGWQFYPSRDSSHDDRFSQFGVFRKGHSRYAYNTLRGVVSIDGREWRALMGDYRYQITSGSGKNRSITSTPSGDRVGLDSN